MRFRRGAPLEAAESPEPKRSTSTPWALYPGVGNTSWAALASLALCVCAVEVGYGPWTWGTGDRLMAKATIMGDAGLVNEGRAQWCARHRNHAACRCAWPLLQARAAGPSKAASSGLRIPPRLSAARNPGPSALPTSRKPTQRICVGAYGGIACPMGTSATTHSIGGASRPAGPISHQQGCPDVHTYSCRLA